MTVSTAVPLVFDTVDSTHVSCNGINDGTINLTVSGGVPAYTYVWVPNVSTTNSATGLMPGTYQITVTDQNLDQIVESVVITEPAPLVVTTPADFSVCPTATVLIDADVTGGTTPYSYSWTPTTNLNNPSIEDPVFDPIGGDATYTLTVIDDNGCTDNDIVMITVHPELIPIISADVLTGCPPLTVNFTNTTSPAGVSCVWDFGDGGNATSCTTTSNVYVTQGSYDISLQITSVEGCVFTSVFGSFITVDPPALGDFTYGTYCANDTDPLPTYVAGRVAGTFSSTVGLVIDSGSGLVDLDASTPGTYTVTNDVTLGACADSFTSDITIYELPTATISASATICSNDPLPDVVIDITAGTANWDITYDFDGTPVNVNSATNQYTITGAAVGTYDLVTITDGNGCTNTISGQSIVDTVQGPTLDLGPDITFCEESVTLDAGAGMDTYLWSTSETTQTIIVSTTNDYWVTVELNGCSETDTVHVTRLDCTGIVEFAGQTVSVYPNPATDLVVIKYFPVNTQLSVVSAKGDVVYSSFETGTQTQLDVSAFESGVYLIRLSNDSESKTIRLVKN